MSNNIVVTIIIATYNSAKNIRVALESVQKQTFKAWECIVIDGASKDNTIEIVKEFEAQDPRFRHISESDSGIYDAFNKGWKMAKGEWVYYLGSDDKLTKDGMAYLLARDHSECSIVSGHVYAEKIDGTTKPVYSIGFAGCHQGKITRRKVFQELGGFNESYKILADVELIYRIKFSGKTIKNEDVFVAYFSMSGVSQKFNSIWIRFKETLRLYREYPSSTKFPFFKAVQLHTILACSVLFRKFKNLIKN